MGGRLSQWTRMGWGMGMMAVGLAAATPCVGAPTEVNLSTIALYARGLSWGGRTSMDRTGTSVAAAGDVNGDGLGDFIVGAPYSDLAETDAGVAYVIFGVESENVINNVEYFNLPGPDGFRIIGVDAPAWRAGLAVSAAGDVNGDGLADVVVSSSAASWGEAYVIFGRVGVADVQLSDIALTFGNTDGFRILGGAISSRLGFSASGAGDFNGDGLADVLLGAPGTSADTGAAHVVFGRTGFFGTIDLSTPAPGEFLTLTGFRANSLTGQAVSGAGDVNGDGHDDVIVGAPWATLPGPLTEAGEAYVVFGTSATSDIPLGNIGGLGNTQGFVIRGATVEDFFGQGVGGAGDVNGDGLHDLVIGGIGVFGGAAGSGAAYVVFGKTNSITVQASSLGTSGFRILGEAFNNWTGWSVAGAGDFDGDGLGDVIVGVPQVTTGGQGSAHVVFGKTSSGDVFLSSPASGIRYFGGAFVSASGYSADGAGDVNGDGIADIVIGSPRSDPRALTESGHVHAVHSPFAFAPDTVPQAATYRAFLPSGSAAARGLGTLRHGADATLFANARLWVSHTEGLGDGPGDSSLLTGTLHREAGYASGFPAGSMAASTWAITQDRWLSAMATSTPATTRFTLRYTDDDLGLLNEANLAVYQSTSRFGPWSALSAQVLETGRNQISGVMLPNPGVEYFLVIADQAPLSPPPNDDFFFAAPFVVTNNGVTATGTTIGATREIGEPAAGLAPLAGSVWYSWTAPFSAPVLRATTCGSTFDSVLGVYTGSDLLSLSVQGTGDDNATWCVPDTDDGYVDFVATQGMTYHFQVSGRGLYNHAGDVALSLGPLNDNFDAAQTLVSTLSGTNFGATLEAGEPPHWPFGAPKASVWYNWTAPATRTYSINTCGSGFDTVLAVYQGPTLGTLTLVGNDDDGTAICPLDLPNLSEVSVHATAGLTYRIAVAGYNGAMGSHSINVLEIQNGDANGDFDINVADLTALHNQLAGITSPPLPGDGDVDNDGDVDLDDAAALREFLVNGVPLP